MAMAAVLLKAFRGGRSRASSQSQPELLLSPAIGRLTPQEGGVVAPLLPRSGSTVPLRRGLGTTTPLLPPSGSAASPASLTAPAAGRPRLLLHKGQGFLSRGRGFSSQGQEQNLLSELKKKYVWTGTSFEMCDSKNVLLYVGEKVDELDYHIKSYQRHWTYPAFTFALGIWFVLSFFVQYVKYWKNKKDLSDLNLLIQEVEKETELVTQELQEVKDKVNLLDIEIS